MYGKLAILEKVFSWQMIQMRCAAGKSVVKCQKEGMVCAYFTGEVSDGFQVDSPCGPLVGRLTGC